MRLKDWCRIAG